MGTAGHSAKLLKTIMRGATGDPRGKDQVGGARTSLGHESSKTLEFSAEWMVNQETQAAQEIMWGDAWRIRNGIESLADRLIAFASGFFIVSNSCVSVSHDCAVLLHSGR
jgi:hypothetical protein